MTTKSRNILTLSLSIALACMVVIPSGCRNDWPLWLYFVAIATLCLGICLSTWGSDYAFNPLPLEKMPRKDKVLHFISFTVTIIGLDFMLGLFGPEWWLAIIGCAIILACSFAQRYLAQKYGNKSL